MRSLRICHRDVFDRYFALALPKGDIPLPLIDRLISVLKDKDQIRRELTDFRDKGRLVDVLNRISAYTSVLDIEGAVPFITALMDLGDSLPDRGAGLFGISPDMTAYLLIYEFLKREKDTKERGRILVEALSSTDGLYLPLQVVSLDEQRREKKDAYDPPLLDDHSWARARKLCVEKIKKGAETGGLLGPKLGYYLWRWKGFSGDEAPKKFVNSLTSTMEGTLRFLRGFTIEARPKSFGLASMHVEPTIDPKEIENFVIVARLRSKIKPLLGAEIPAELSSIAAEYGRELTAFKRALNFGQGNNADQSFRVCDTTAIDINSATQSELAELPGIDLELAQRIIDRRPYQTVDQVRLVKGIGKTRFSKLKGRIKV
jgi:DNA uptake protein ComE-like DNA-binding protein